MVAAPAGGRLDDRLQIEPARRETGGLAHTVGLRDQHGRIAGAARPRRDRDRAAGHPLDGGDDLPNGPAAARPEVERLEALASLASMPGPVRPGAIRNL